MATAKAKVKETVEEAAEGLAARARETQFPRTEFSALDDLRKRYWRLDQLGRLALEVAILNYVRHAPPVAETRTSKK